jgi:F-type H+-transporting ATPase subunit delta
MTNRAAASRYARALLDVVVSEARRPAEAAGRMPETHEVRESREPTHPREAAPSGEPGSAALSGQAAAAGAGEAVQRIERELAGVVDLLGRYPALQHVLLNPAIPVARKRAAVSELVARAGVAPVLSKLLVLLAERDRLILLPDLLAAYRERALDYLNIVRAELTTAVPLAAERVDAVAGRLARATGRAVQLQSRVDPSIIGGVVARIGSTVYDGSLTRHLARMRERLSE